MSLLNELNQNITLVKELESSYEELKIESTYLQLEAPNQDGSLDWVPPTEKPVITKSAGEEKVARKVPVIQKGSRVMVPMQGKHVIGIVSDVQDGGVVVAINSGGKVLRLPPQPRDRFVYTKPDSAGNPVFVLKGNFKSNAPAPNEVLPPA